MLELLKENLVPIIILILGSGIIGAGLLTGVKKLSKKGAIVFKELSEAFGSGANLLSKLNKDIENDGRLDANEIKELLIDGKTVIKEFKDVIVEIKPKKVDPPL